MSKDVLHRGPTFVKKSPIHGYGVFASQNIAAGELIEECYTLFSSKGDTELINYVFGAHERVAIPLGYGCIYNHSSTPNVTYQLDLDRGLIVFTARQAIRQGEELFCSYGEKWFSSRELKVKERPWWREVYCRATGLPLRAALVLSGFFALLQGLKHLTS